MMLIGNLGSYTHTPRMDNSVQGKTVHRIAEEILETLLPCHGFPFVDNENKFID